MPPLGTLYAPSLTRSGNIQNWTSGEVICAIRDGIHKNGRALLIMPARSYRKMSDDDVQDLGGRACIKLYPLMPPEFETILKVIEALGLEFSVMPVKE